MADDVRALPDTTREEILRAAAEALAAQAPALPPDAVALLRALHAAVPTAELAAIPPEARWMVFQFIEVQMAALNALADDADVARAVAILDARPRR